MKIDFNAISFHVLVKFSHNHNFREIEDDFIIKNINNVRKRLKYPNREHILNLYDAITTDRYTIKREIIPHVEIEKREKPIKREIEIVPSLFHGRGKVGDFSWMIENENYNDAFFIFNDNEGEYVAFRDGKGGLEPGANNAEIRPYQGKIPPRALGIPTGRYGKIPVGYTDEELKDQRSGVQKIIDESISRIRNILKRYPHYKRVIYSATSKTNTALGAGIFAQLGLGMEVRKYIVQQIYQQLSEIN